jgi:hypothetical protein
MPAVKAASARRRPSRRDSDFNQDSKPILPAFRPFQLATLEKRVPSGDSWLFEMKFDGYRAQAAIAGAEVRVYPPQPPLITEPDDIVVQTADILFEYRPHDSSSTASSPSSWKGDDYRRRLRWRSHRQRLPGNPR